MKTIHYLLFFVIIKIKIFIVLINIYFILFQIYINSFLILMNDFFALNCFFCKDDSKYLLTAAADMTARLWEVETGEQLAVYAHDRPGTV